MHESEQNGYLLNIPILEPRVEPDERDIVYGENIRLAPAYVYAADLKNLSKVFLGMSDRFKKSSLSITRIQSPTEDFSRFVLQSLKKEKQENGEEIYWLYSVEVNSSDDTVKVSDKDLTHIAKFENGDVQKISGIEKLGMFLPFDENNFDENNFDEHVKIERIIDDLQRALIEKTCDPLTLEDYTDDLQAGRNAFVKRFVVTSSLHKDAMDGAHIRLDDDSYIPEIFQALRAAGLSETKSGAKKIASVLVPLPSGFPVIEIDQPAAMSHSMSDGFYLTRKTEFSPHENVHTNYYQLSFRKPS